MGALIKGPSMPKQKDPVRIPNPGDPDIMQAAAAKRREEEQQRRGRRSTDLSGGAYSKTTMG